MKRTFVLVAILSALASLTFACASEDDSTLGYNNDTLKKDDGNGNDDRETTSAIERAEPAPVKTSPAPVSAPAAAPTTTPIKPVTPALSASCVAAEATTKADCQKCCALKSKTPPPSSSCSCGAGSKCGNACDGNLCDGNGPSIACGICLIATGCKPGDNGSPGKSESELCLDTCNAKP